ncbi:CRIB domain-containing protein RIC5-like [Fagus crenata]
MATKVKSLLKGLRYISHIFDEKEPEMQIGFPTDVKHVAHIGWDGPSTNTPSWIREYKSTQEESAGVDSHQDKKLTGAAIHESLLRNIRSTGSGLSPVSSPRWRLDEAKQTRHHRSRDVSADSPSRDSTHTTRHMRQHRNSSQDNDSPSQDLPAVPKHTRRRKSKGSSGGTSARSSRSKGQNSLPDIPFSDMGFGSGSGHGVKNNENNLNSILEVKEEGGCNDHENSRGNM